MAFPPRFFPASGFQPPPQIYFNPMIPRFGIPPMQNVSTEKSKPVTTVFVGNISEKCSNEFMQQMLQECGVVTSWKRIQGSNGKYQAFGFCDFEEPEGTLRALRVLSEFQIGEKKLVVKAEDKVRDELRKWAIQQRSEDASESGIVKGKPELTLKDGELPADEDDLKKDEEVRLKILNWIETDHPELLTVAEDGELSDKEAKDLKGKDRETRRRDRDDDKKRKDGIRDKSRERRRRRTRSRSHSRGRDDKRRRRASPKHKRRRHSSSASSRSSSSSSSASDSSRSRSPKKTKKERSVSRSSEDSEDARERRAQKKQVKEKELAYALRLKKWEKRERDQAKKYEREERREKERKRDMLSEAKKLKAFLEDYDDERDDSKYYTANNIFQRRRDFEREREADMKDRLREQQEIEEIKRQILSDKENTLDSADVEAEAKKRHQAQEEAALRRLRGDSGSPNPHQKLGNPEEDSSSSSSSEEEEDETKDNGTGGASTATATPTLSISTTITDKWKTVGESNGVSSTPPAKSTELGQNSPAQGIRKDLTSRLNGVFGMEDEEDGKKKMRPFEITQEERAAVMSDDERKKLTKQLIANIPTNKDDLFAYKMDWSQLNEHVMENRVRPWVSKKIQEYIGDQDQDMVDFICDKLKAQAPAETILSDVQMVLEEDAETFVVKMWRLMIYESEAKKLGLQKSGGK